MGGKSKIEWTDATWTPIRARNKAGGKVGWHCVHKYPGCANCYSEGMNMRLGTGLPFKPGHEKDIEIFLDEKMLMVPLSWKKPRTIFVCSTTDLFADCVPDDWIDEVFAVMALCPHHTFHVLTKRSARMKEWFLSSPNPIELHDRKAAVFETMNSNHATNEFWSPGPIQWPLPNVWLGVSAEDHTRYDERKDDLRMTL